MFRSDNPHPEAHLTKSLGMQQAPDIAIQKKRFIKFLTQPLTGYCDIIETI